MKSIYWDDCTEGMKFEYRDVPANMLEQCKEWREKMIEAAAEANDDLMHKYLETGELDVEEIKAGLRERAIRNEICITLCGSAFKNKGVQAMLDAVIEYMPSPIEVPPVRGIDRRRQGGARAGRRRRQVLRARVQDPDRPVRRQPDVLPRLLGRAELGRHGLRARESKKERIGRLLQMHANEREEIKEVRAGDIAAAVGLKDVTTGDTLCDPKHSSRSRRWSSRSR